MPAPTRLFKLPASGRQSVAGEHYYQPAIRDAVAGRFVPFADSDNWDATLSVPAILMPEPGNPYDSNAVAVHLNGRCVGHLPRMVAPDYQTALLELNRAGMVGVCEGRIVRNTLDGEFAVYLHLGDPRSCALAVEWHDEADYLGGDRVVTVAGSARMQPAIRRVHLPNHATTEQIALLQLGTIERGKNSGQHCIEVYAHRVYVGTLTRTMSARYEHLVQRADTAGRIAITRLVTTTQEGPELKAYVLMRRNAEE